MGWGITPAAQRSTITRPAAAIRESSRLAAMSPGVFAMATIPPISDDTFWTPAKSKVIPNAITAPDGKSKADMWVPNAGAGYDPGTYLAHPVGGSLAGKRLTAWVKPAGNAKAAKFVRQNGAGVGSALDCNAGTIAENYSTAAGTAENAGDGWIKFSVDILPAATMQATDLMYLLGGNSGDGSSGVYIWFGPATADTSASANQAGTSNTSITEGLSTEAIWGIGLGIAGLLYTMSRGRR